MPAAPNMLTSAQIRQVAHGCGFEIAGVTEAAPHGDFARFQTWAAAGMASQLEYLTDRRGDLRGDPRKLLASAKSIICLGKMYQTERPLSIEVAAPGVGWVSRYAWGLDYHDILRPALERLVEQIVRLRGSRFDSKICIDTAPLLERSYGQAAGLGWIGRNTCLINENFGSWFFLAELLVDFEIAPDRAAADRCGTCSRCIDACPTGALIPNSAGGCDLDARLCISYLTIEKRGALPEADAQRTGNHIFGCDICQDVCPWNQRASRFGLGYTGEESFSARLFAPDLEELAGMDEDEFRRRFRHTPLWRAKYSGFLRNVAVAMGNSGKRSMREPLSRLAAHSDSWIAESAQAALTRLETSLAD